MQPRFLHLEESTCASYCYRCTEASVDGRCAGAYPSLDAERRQSLDCWWPPTGAACQPAFINAGKWHLAREDRVVMNWFWLQFPYSDAIWQHHFGLFKQEVAVRFPSIWSLWSVASIFRAVSTAVWIGFVTWIFNSDFSLFLLISKWTIGTINPWPDLMLQVICCAKIWRSRELLFQSIQTVQVLKNRLHRFVTQIGSDSRK